MANQNKQNSSNHEYDESDGINVVPKDVKPIDEWPDKPERTKNTAERITRQSSYEDDEENTAARNKSIRQKSRDADEPEKNADESDSDKEEDSEDMQDEEDLDKEEAKEIKSKEGAKSSFLKKEKRKSQDKSDDEDSDKEESDEEDSDDEDSEESDDDFEENKKSKSKKADKNKKHNGQKQHKAKQEIPRKPGHKKTKTIPWKTILIIIGILAIIGLMVFLYMKGMLTPKTTGQETSKELQGKITLAKVNGEAITLAEVENMYAALPPMTQMFVTKTQLLNSTIDRLLLLQEAKQQGITYSEIDAEKAIQELMLQENVTKTFVEEQLAKQNKTWAEFIVQYDEEMIITQLLNKTIFNETEVTDALLQTYYDTNKEQFATPEQVRASHILICYANITTCNNNRTKEEAESLTADLLGQVKSGADIGMLAKKYSDDPSAAQNSGDLSYFRKGEMVQQFEDMAFSLAINETSFTQTQYGYHVIRVTDKTPEKVIPFAEVKEMLRAQMQQEKERQGYTLYMQTLRSKASIVFDDKNMKELEGNQTLQLGDLGMKGPQIEQIAVE